MSTPPLVQLWQQGTTTCRISPVTESAPYWVVIQHGDEASLPRAFETHDEAVSYAVEELRRATGRTDPR